MKKTTISLLAVLMGAATYSNAALVSTIDPAGAASVDFEGTTSGNLISMSDFQTVITTVGDVSLAGVFDNETSASGALNTDDDYGTLASGLTINGGGGRYGRGDVGTARGEVSGVNGMFINGSETFTLSAPTGRLFSHFGWVAWGTATQGYDAVATFSGGGTATMTSSGNDGLTFIGFVAPTGESITTVQFSEDLPGFGGGDDVAFATTVVPEPSSTALLGLGGLALILRRRK